MKEFLKAKYIEKRFADKEKGSVSESEDDKEDSGDESPEKPKKKVMRHKKKSHFNEEEH